MGDLGEKLVPVIEPLLDTGEELRGACIATQVGLFKGRMVALATTDRRLIVQALNRRFERDGEPFSITRGELSEASADGAGGGWPEIGAAIMDRAAVTLELRTVSGKKLKLTMMRAEGPLAKLSGGETQRRGLEALAAWLSAGG